MTKRMLIISFVSNNIVMNVELRCSSKKKVLKGDEQKVAKMGRTKGYSF